MKKTTKWSFTVHALVRIYWPARISSGLESETWSFSWSSTAITSTVISSLAPAAPSSLCTHIRTGQLSTLCIGVLTGAWQGRATAHPGTLNLKPGWNEQSKVVSECILKCYFYTDRCTVWEDFSLFFYWSIHVIWEFRVNWKCVKVILFNTNFAVRISSRLSGNCNFLPLPNFF